LEIGAELIGGEGFELIADADAGAAVGEAEVAFAQEEREFVGRFVFDGIELLDGEVAGGFEAVIGEVWALDDVAVDGEDCEEVFAEHHGGEPEEDGFCVGGAGDAEAIEVGGEFAGVAVAGSAEDPIGDDGGGSGGGGGVGGGTGGDEEGHGGGADGGHFFGDEGESVGEGVDELLGTIGGCDDGGGGGD
jgi:hypothetical protein